MIRIITRVTRGVTTLKLNLAISRYLFIKLIKEVVAQLLVLSIVAIGRKALLALTLKISLFRLKYQIHEVSTLHECGLAAQTQPLSTDACQWYNAYQEFVQKKVLPTMLYIYSSLHISVKEKQKCLFT